MGSSPYEGSPPWFTEELGCFGPRWLVEYEALISPEETHRQVEFLERNLPLRRGMRIFDVPCGHGRHAVELARRGYDVLGIDINKFFLHQARDAANREGLSIEFQNEDMREVSWIEKFDVAINLYTSLGYFHEDAEDQKILCGISRALKLGGAFVLDFINRDAFVRNYRPRWERALADGSILVTEPEYDMLRGRNICRRTILTKEGIARQLESFDYRLYSPVELIGMSANAGLRFHKAYGDFDASALTMDSKRAILIFKK